MNPLQGGSGLMQGGSGIMQGVKGQSLQQSMTTPQVQNAGGINIAQPTIAKNKAFISQGQAGLSSTNDFLKNIEQQLALETQLANKPLAPTLNYNAIQAQAKAQASKNVNPLYTQKLNQYLQNEAAVTANQKQQNQLAVQTAQEALQNSQAQNTLAQQETGQKTALDIGNINQQQANMEQNAGNAFDTQRQQLNQSIGQGGLSASGMGQQQIVQARLQNNIQKTQQNNQFAYNRNASLLNEQSTFDQLAQSGKYAVTQAGEAKSKANLDLNAYLQQAAYSQQQFRQSNEQQRQADILTQANQLASQRVAQFVNSFRNNPGVYNAALNAYSGLMRT